MTVARTGIPMIRRVFRSRGSEAAAPLSKEAYTLKPTTTLPVLFALGATMVASLAASTSGFASSSYDGSWHVMVTADPGRCSDHFAVALRVSNGHVSYAGPFG